LKKTKGSSEGGNDQWTKKGANNDLRSWDPWQAKVKKRPPPKKARRRTVRRLRAKQQRLSKPIVSQKKRTRQHKRHTDEQKKGPFWEGLEREPRTGTGTGTKPTPGKRSKVKEDPEKLAGKKRQRRGWSSNLRARGRGGKGEGAGITGRHRVKRQFKGNREWEGVSWNRTVGVSVKVGGLNRGRTGGRMGGPHAPVRAIKESWGRQGIPLVGSRRGKPRANAGLEDHRPKRKTKRDFPANFGRRKKKPNCEQKPSTKSAKKNWRKKTRPSEPKAPLQKKTDRPSTAPVLKKALRSGTH